MNLCHHDKKKIFCPRNIIISAYQMIQFYIEYLKKCHSKIIPKRNFVFLIVTYLAISDI